MNLNELTITAEIPLGANLDNRTTIGYDSDGDPIYPGVEPMNEAEWTPSCVATWPWWTPTWSEWHDS